MLEIKVQMYTKRTIIPPKKSKIIKYLIHFLVREEIRILIIIEITINIILARRGLWISVIKTIK